MTDREVPAGWYSHDEGKERYWDGTAWTDEWRGPQPPLPAKRTNWGIVAIVIVGLLVVAVIGAAGGEDSETSSDEGQRNETAQVDLSAEDYGEIIATEKFCRAYANALSAGLGEDFAFGNFLRGYQSGEVPAGADLPPAREVFDEAVEGC